MNRPAAVPGPTHRPSQLGLHPGATAPEHNNTSMLNSDEASAGAPGALRRAASLTGGYPNPGSIILGLRRALTPKPKAGAQCVRRARWDLRGGRRATGVPTAIQVWVLNFSHFAFRVGWCGRLGGWRSGRLCATRGQTDIRGLGPQDHGSSWGAAV